MDMIRVDPKLFITCRLCLDEMGVYQIIPLVQQQIKYCFDIDVDSFDGLPQLICKKCQGILIAYYETKETYTKKQNDLKIKIDGSLGFNSEEPESSQSKEKSANLSLTSESDIIDRPVLSSKQKKKRNKLPSTSTSEDECIKPSNKKNESKKNECSTIIWKPNYNKYFICKFCNKSFRYKSKVIDHVRKHKRYNEILSKCCSVQLDKCDGGLNLTGTNEVVVHDCKEIRQNVINNDYYIRYTFKDHNSDQLQNASKMKTISSDSSLDEVVTKYKKQKKRRRVSSRSSNETIVIERNNTSENQLTPKIYEEETPNGLLEKQNITKKVVECVDVDDSSDSTDVPVAESRDSESDQKTIQNIILLGYNKYLHNLEKGDTENVKRKTVNTDALLRRKILSIGRKMITMKGFNTTGILRYLEHKNLEVDWMPKTQNKFSQIKSVMINTKVKGQNKNNKSNLVWKDLTDEIPRSEILNKEVSSTGKTTMVHTTDQTVVSENNLVTPILPCNTQISKSQILENVPSPVIEKDRAVLSKVVLDNEPSKKILNPSPVANPKQLPKKSNIFETSTINIRDVTIDEHTPNVENNIDNIVMPIITSTTSLAPECTGLKESYNINNATEGTVHVKNNKKKEEPRIKVKPVSELMPSGNGNTQQTSSTNKSWHVNETQNVAFASMSQLLNDAANGSQRPAWQINQNDNFSNDNYIIMNTTEFPNIRSHCPFQYLKNLLHIYNIFLMDSTEPLSELFLCLIKFKLVFQQEGKDPVTLILGLYCNQNKFSIKVNNDLNVAELSAKWQWEILKAYKGDVVNRIMQNAQKISSEVANITKRFISLLKSISVQST